MAAEDYYKILGLQSSATEKDIRRAYRILARRYHPDVNPGNDSSTKFQMIAEAYKMLSDPIKRRQHDLELARIKVQRGPKGHRAYSEEMRKRFDAQSRFFKKNPAQPRATTASQRSRVSAPQPQSPRQGPGFFDKVKQFIEKPLTLQRRKTPAENTKEKFTKSVAIVEVSLSVPEAITGTKKTLEIEGGGETRKISVKIPSGVYSGSVVRMRSDRLQGEELVLIIQLADHPFLSLGRNGLTVDLPVSLHEAYSGAALQVPTLQDPVLLKIPPRSQNGTLVRLKDKGPKDRDGKPTDLLFRITLHGPREELPPQYANLLEEFDNAYSAEVRRARPQHLVEPTNS